MGILQNGLPYLTQSGLSKAIGIGQSTLSKITKEWREAHSDPVMPRSDSRLGYLKEYLHKERFSEPELYIEVEVENATHYAYPSVVCMALIEYYAFESHPPNATALKLYRGFARFGFQEFIYKALQYVPEDKWRYFHDRASLNRNSAPNGYFMVFNEISGMIVDLIRANLRVNEFTIPDISVGKLWSDYWKEEGLDSKFGKRLQCEHCYPDYYPQAKSNPQVVWAYPNMALADFRYWFTQTYLPTKFPRYILRKAKVLRGGIEEAKQIAGMY